MNVLERIAVLLNGLIKGRRSAESEESAVIIVDTWEAGWAGFNRALTREGIPYVEDRQGILEIDESYHDLVLALANEWIDGHDCNCSSLAVWH